MVLFPYSVGGQDAVSRLVLDGIVVQLAEQKFDVASLCQVNLLGIVNRLIVQH